MKASIKKIPVVGTILQKVYQKLINPPKPFNGSANYWESRYAEGGNSGEGSYGRLAQFKAEFLNDFVEKNSVQTVIEYGSGDGNQLTMARYPEYTGFDVSTKALAICREKFAGDPTKSFKLTDDYQGETAQLTMSLDVIYHLTEDVVFEAYMNRLFDSSEQFVIVYSSDTDDNSGNVVPHVRHRAFTKWVAANKPDWQFNQKVDNLYPLDGDTSSGSFADFYIYERVSPLSK